MKKTINILVVVCLLGANTLSPILLAQPPVTLQNGWIAGNTVPSSCKSGASATFYNWSTFALYDCVNNVYQIRSTGAAFTWPSSGIPVSTGSNWTSSIPSTFLGTGTGGINRSFQSKFADVVNVKDYGALCDGSHDDHDAFQSANDAVNGGTINMPQGVCVIGSNINSNKDNTDWVGAGWGATKLQMGAGVTKLFNVTNNSGSNQLVLPRFFNFSVDGTASPTGVAFYVNGARSVTFDTIYTSHCYKSYFIDQGPLTTSTVYFKNFFIEDITDTSGARGIQINGGGDAFFIEHGRMFNNAHETNSVGLELTSGGGFMVSQVDISSMGRAFLVDPASGQWVRYSQFHVFQCDTSYQNNMTLDGSAAGGSPAGVYSITFTNSWFSSAGAFGGSNGYGVDLVSSNGITIDTSMIFGNSLDGIRIRVGANQTILTSNKISGNSNGAGNGGANVGVHSGILLDASVDTVLMANNISGVIGANAFSQKYGLDIGVGAVNYTVIGNNFENNVTGAYHDLANAGNSSYWGNLPVGSTFAGLGTPTNGFQTYCSNCDTPASQGATCSSSGDQVGALAIRIRGGFKCY